MKSAVLIAAGVLAFAAPMQAQEAPPAATPQSATPAGATPAGATPAGATPAGATPPVTAPRPHEPRAQESRRDELRLMETALIQAVQKGAQELARQLKVSEPDSAFVMGTGRARGFLLDGYGVFFDVDVPEMRQSVVWSAQMLELVQQRANIERFLRNSAPDDPRRAFAMNEARRFDRMIALATGSAVPMSPNQNTQLETTDKGIAVATSLGDSTPAAPPVASALAPAPAAGAPAPSANAEPGTPDALYTTAVKNALIDSMLTFGFALKLTDDEWLTVAASDGTGPQVPGGFDDASRIVLRIKGADLTAFRAGKLTRDEVRKRVEVREF